MKKTEKDIIEENEEKKPTTKKKTAKKTNKTIELIIHTFLFINLISSLFYLILFIPRPN